MPKIKVYKGNGKIIPVDNAKLSTGYRCPWSDKIFGTKRDYVKHLRQWREDVIHSEIHKNNRNKILQELIEQRSFDAIINWVNTHAEFLYDGIVHDGRNKWGEKIPTGTREKFRLEITFLDVKWSDCVSNSHESPRDGVTNWSREKDKPMGYPGWTGRIEFHLNNENLCFGSDIMRSVGIMAGGGGSTGGGQHGYGVTFFASDWPGLAKEAIFRKLKEEKADSFRYGKARYFR